MSIIPSLLICSPTLQCEYVDKTGEPLAAGIVTCYQDNSRTTLKNWYYQSGTPGNYTYIALPNPLVLSDAGSIQDVNGNDTLPFFYPYSEIDNETFQPYFITVVDSNGELQFSRANFPYLGDENPGPVGPQTYTSENYVINNRFWRNITSKIIDTSTNALTNTFTQAYNTSGTYYYITLAPSQHDSFSMPDLNYIKNNNSSTETITFNVFPQTVKLIGDITPEYYINHTCTGAGSGENLKVYQFPASLHIDTLNNQSATFTIQGQSVTGPATLPIYIYQFLGTGTTSATPIEIGTVTLTPAWSKQTVQFVFPPSSGVVLSTTGDDALYLQIGMPINTTFQLNFALPSIYLSPEANVPTNEFQTYDQIDGVIGTPRTGDVRTSLNSFYPFGWVPMNNGAIGLAASPSGFPLARNNVDCWPLFNLLWNLFSAYTVSTTNSLAQMYTSVGVAVAYGANAITDWKAGNFISLTKQMGQVVLGTVPASAFLPATSSFPGSTSTFTVTSSSGLLITTAQPMLIFQGMPITFSTSTGVLPTGITANTVYYITADSSFSTTTFHISTSFANAVAGTAVSYTNTGTPPNNVSFAIAGAFEGEYAHTQLLTELASHVHTTAVPSAAGGQMVTAGANAINNVSQNVTSSTPVGGATNPFNVTQPGTFLNIYMKL